MPKSCLARELRGNPEKAKEWLVDLFSRFAAAIMESEKKQSIFCWFNTPEFREDAGFDVDYAAFVIRGAPGDVAELREAVEELGGKWLERKKNEK